MSSSFRHIDTARFMGSWPILQESATILPRTLHTSARILGTVRETSSGYDVDGRSFYVIVDGEPAFSVTFSSVLALTLDEVITQVNADSQAAISQDIAFRDNGFLLLKSPTTGVTSYLRLYTDSVSSPTDVFEKLGLFSETESWGGDIASATHADPDRQVAMPDQMSVMEGEPLTARVVNRALMQLSLQNDMVYNLTHRRRMARTTQVTEASYSSSTPEGYQFSGGTMVYVGATPDPDKYFQIVDSDGKEFTKEEVTELADYPGTLNCVEVSERTTQDGTTTPVYECRAVSSVAIFLADDPNDNHYVVVTMAGVAALSGIPLKIIRFVSSTEVVFAPIDPVTGSDLTDDVVTEVGTGGAYVSDIVKQSVALVPCQVEGVYDSAGGSLVEGVKTDRLTGITPTKVELGNRITFLGEDAVTAGVAIGDELVWSGHSPASGVQDNNGTYRISAVIDKETVEVVGGDWNPVVLSSDLFTTGAVTIQVDGEFVEDPFLKFVPSPAGAIPEVGDAVVIQYYGMKTLKEAWDDDPTLLSGDLERQHESSDVIEKAILNILGPSTNNLTDYVRQEASINLEAIDLRLDQEHHNLGKHSSINADTLFVYQNATAGQYLDQRGPTNWDAKTATFFNRSDLVAVDDAVVSVISQSTDSGAGAYVGGIKVRVEGASTDAPLYGYVADLTVEANAGTGAALGYVSRANFSDGNADTVAHFAGNITGWTGTNSLSNEYGVWMQGMTRGTNQVGLQVDSMNAAGAASVVSAGAIDSAAAEAAAVRVGAITSTSSAAMGFWCGAIDGNTGGYGMLVEGVTSAAFAQGLNTGAITSGTGNALGASFGIIQSTSSFAYGIRANDITGATDARGFSAGDISGTSGDARGVHADTVSGPSAYGLYTGAVTGSTGVAQGVNITSLTGVGAAGVNTGAIAGGTGDAYGVNVASITGNDANGLYVGNLTASGGPSSTARGVRCNNLSGSIVYGMFTGTLTSSVGDANGFYTSTITGEDDARGLRFGDIIANTGAAFGCHANDITATAGNAYGIHLQDVTGGGGEARGFDVGTLTGTSAYALVAGAISSTATWARGVVLSSIDASSGTAAVGFWTDTITGDTDARGARFNTISGTDAVGIREDGDITASTGSAHALEVAGTISTTGGTEAAAAIKTGAITSAAGIASAFWVDGTISVTGGSGSAVGVGLGAVTSSGGESYGFYASNITGSTSAHALTTGIITATAGSAYGVQVGNLVGTDDSAAFAAGDMTVSAGRARGVWLGDLQSSDVATGFLVGTVTSTGGNAWGLYIGTVSGTTISRAIQTTGGAHLFGDYVNVKGVVEPQSDNTYDLGDSTGPLRWRYALVGTSVLVGDETAPSTPIGVRVLQTTSTGDITGFNSIVTSTWNNGGADTRGFYAYATSNSTSVQQKAVVGLESIALTGTGNGGVLNAYGVRSAVDLNNTTGVVTNAAAYFADAHTPVTAPQFHVGYWCEPHTGGSDASASIYSEGGAVLVAGSGSTPGSLAVAPTTNLLSSTYITAATQYAVNLIGDNTTVAYLNFDNLDIGASDNGGSYYMGVDTNDFTLWKGSRDRSTHNVQVFSVLEQATPVIDFRNHRMRVLRENDRCFESDCNIDVGNPTGPVASVDIDFSGAGQITTSNFTAQEVTLVSTSKANGAYDGVMYCNATYGAIPGWDSTATLYGYYVRLGRTADYGEAVSGHSVGFHAELTLRGTETSPTGSTGSGFQAEIDSDATYTNRFGFYCRNMTTLIGDTSVAYGIQSMTTRSIGSITYGLWSGNILAGSSGTPLAGSANVYGMYFSGVRSYNTAGTTYAYGLYFNDITASETGASSVAYAYGVYVNEVSGSNVAHGITATNVTASVTGTARGVRVANVTGVGSAIGVDIADVTNTAGSPAYGIYIDIVGTTSTANTARGVYIKNVRAGAAATTMGVHVDTISSGLYRYGFYADDPGSASTHYGLYIEGSCRLGNSGRQVYSPAIRDDLIGSGVNVHIDLTSGELKRVTSLREYKTDIQDMGDTSWVYKLRPVSFEVKMERGITRYGLIAEEVEEVSPELAMYSYEYEDVDDDYVRQEGEIVVAARGQQKLVTTKKLESVGYDQLAPVLLNELKKLNERVTELEARLN